MRGQGGFKGGAEAQKRACLWTVYSVGRDEDGSYWTPGWEPCILLRRVFRRSRVDLGKGGWGVGKKNDASFKFFLCFVLLINRQGNNRVYRVEGDFRFLVSCFHYERKNDVR